MKFIQSNLFRKFIINISFILISVTLFYSCLPKSDEYPYRDPELVKQEGKKISDNLEIYIKKWLKGEVSANIPAELIPKGITDSKNFYLKKADEVTSKETWAFRFAKPINRDSLLNGLPDPNVTYLLLGTALAPFGSKLIIEGEFPHARFFSIQVSPPLNGNEYYANRVYGTAEVSITDTDIDPLPGNVNPYRIGSNRNATNRKYRVEYDLAIGDPVALNDKAHIPLYRQKGNKRAGSMLVFQGPWGSKDFKGDPLPGGGDWNLGAVWIRIYAPDKSKGPLGGVPMPKVYFELPTGEKYFVGSDFSELTKRADMTSKARVINEEPSRTAANPNWGMVKSWGLPRNILNGVLLANNWDSTERVNKIDLGVTGRGEFQPAPGNYEAHATVNNYCSYLGKSVNIQPGMVAVLTGKLPTFPDTRNGNPEMKAAQIRYWSVGGYDNYYLATNPGVAVNLVMDDEVKIDNNRDYVIVYGNDQPVNATTANGATWVNWGPTAELGLMMRWVTLSPEWEFEKSPHERNLTWAKTDFSGSQYDSTLIGQNSHKGFMGCYLPRITMMTKAEFEALGSKISAEDIPFWIDNKPVIGLSDAKGKPSQASSVTDNFFSSNAFDGKLNTSWASVWGNTPQFLMVNLGSPKKISGVKLLWEFASAGTSYDIQVGNTSNGPWSTVYSTVSGNGGVDVINGLKSISQYVRIYITKGQLPTYILKEMEVYSPQMDCNNNLTNIEIAHNENHENSLNLFPNPASDFININFKEFEYANGIPLEISVFDNASRFIFKKTVLSSTEKIDISKLQKGIYILQAKFKNKIYSKKFSVLEN